MYSWGSDPLITAFNDALNGPGTIDERIDAAMNVIREDFERNTARFVADAGDEQP